jgi:tRNA(adenine34) deaminase
MINGMIDPTEAAAAWAAVEQPWQLAFELAWEAFQAGSVPVGAVVVDPGGDLVTQGRSRSNEPTGPSGQLAGTYLAHAEVNALAGLAPGDYWSHVLYTTLEPCLLCTAALTHAHVGAVRYAASDPLWAGIERLPRLNQHIAGRWPDRQGPLSGPLAGWGGLLPLIWSLARAADGPVARAYEQTAPPLLQLARVLVGSGEIVALRQLPLAQALHQIWPRLLTLQRHVGRKADHQH